MKYKVNLIAASPFIWGGTYFIGAAVGSPEKEDLTGQIRNRITLLALRSLEGARPPQWPVTEDGKEGNLNL